MQLREAPDLHRTMENDKRGKVENAGPDTDRLVVW